jgi:DNA-binding PadR family transcriptional regulator
VLLALIRAGDDAAYGVPIANAIAESTGKRVILASVYNTLERLEQKGLVTSSFGEPTAERGGRAKRYFSITRAGLREVRAAKKALTVLWRGIPVHEG